MPANPTVTGPIVVGTGGSEPSNLAVDWAARQAALHRLPLAIAHAFLWPVRSAYLGSFPVGPGEGWETAAEEMLAGSARLASAACAAAERPGSMARAAVDTRCSSY